MAVSPYKTFISGEVLTAFDLNSSITQITDNGQDVSFPRTESADFDGQELILDSDADTSITADTDDRIDFRLRGTDLFRLDGATGGTTVNGLDFIASAAGSAVQIATVGSDAAIALNLVTKSTGELQWDGNKIATEAAILGLDTFEIPVDAMRPATTSGCAAHTQVELVAGQPELVVLDFDGTSDEYALFSAHMPKGWNQGTITARFSYTVSAAVSTTVTWGLQAVAVGDNQAIATAYGTAGTVTDTFHGTANLKAVTAYTSAITIAGTPAEGDRIYFRVLRDPDSDTTTQDARLEGVTIQFTRSALNDA